MSLPKYSLRFASMFEGEVLVELMLRYWEHPLADDEEFRNGLLETAAEVLRASINGEKLMEDIPPDSMNLIAAIWFSEWNTIVDNPELKLKHRKKREKWLSLVRRAIPSCFCDPDELG